MISKPEIRQFVSENPDFFLKQYNDQGSNTASNLAVSFWDQRVIFIDNTAKDTFLKPTSILKNKASSKDLEVIFKGLAKNWQDATRSYSLNMRRYAHETYQVLIHTISRENANDIIPIILNELKQKPDMWFEALKIITKENPAKDAQTFDEAVRAWLDWGKLKKYIA